MPKQLAVEQTFRQRATIHPNKRGCRPGAESVQGTGDKLFAGSRLSKQQNRRIAFRRQYGQAIDFLHRGALADQAKINRFEVRRRLSRHRAINQVSGG